MGSGTQKVLVITGSVVCYEQTRSNLNGLFDVIGAFTEEDALERFSLYRNSICVIAIDSSFTDGGNCKTLFLLKTLRTSFVGPMIAISCVSDFQYFLCAFGCDHSSLKDELATRIRKLIYEGVLSAVELE